MSGWESVSTQGWEIEWMTSAELKLQVSMFLPKNLYFFLAIANLARSMVDQLISTVEEWINAQDWM